MVYATYDYYRNDYVGDTLTEQEFRKYARKASAEIDHVTFGRLSDTQDSEIPDAVRDATCDIAEKMHHYDTADGREVASETNDGLSISYRDTGTQSQQLGEIRMTIRTYLAATGLMYRGVDKDYDCCDT